MDYGSIGISKGLLCASFLTQTLKGRKKILCLGAGNAYEVVHFLKNGHDCYSVELYFPGIEYLRHRQIKALGQHLPFRDKEFDLFFCCETLEHIEEKYIDSVLLEAKRVSENCFFTIATRHDRPFNTHICIHNAQWWFDKFQELGFEINYGQLNLRIPLFIDRLFTIPGSTTVMFSDGVLIDAKC